MSKSGNFLFINFTDRNSQIIFLKRYGGVIQLYSYRVTTCFYQYKHMFKHALLKESHSLNFIRKLMDWLRQKLLLCTSML